MTMASFKLFLDIGLASRMPDANRPHGAAASAIKLAHLISGSGVPKGFRTINTPIRSARRSGLRSWLAIALNGPADGAWWISRMMMVRVKMMISIVMMLRTGIDITGSKANCVIG